MNSNNIIPYKKNEYDYFKKLVKNICEEDKYCFFYNLENVVADNLWTNEKDIKDFMHFKYEGHEILYLILKEKIKNFI